LQLVTDKGEMRRIVLENRRGGRTVGFVPTMGYFHPGHLSLMRRAREENDLVVVSIFVNPLQFGPSEDLASYPRDLERDCRQAEEEGVDYVFCPTPESMYPQPFLTRVKVEGITEGLCGAFRPGHFDGVATVVAKLFHIVPAQRAYFGQKDAQQARVIRKMAEDLDFEVEVRVCPTVREEDGLAMSSRNVYLEAGERQKACLLYKALTAGRRLAEKGERDAAAVVAEMSSVLEKEPAITVEYLGAYDGLTLDPLQELRGEVLLAVAARVGKARLIDNITVVLDD
jgi:pantoate--beta-alanine ligase